MGIADDADVLRAAEPDIEQELLQRVDILVLIHHEVRVPAPDLGSRHLVLGQYRGGQLENRLEIHQMAFPAQFLVAGVKPGQGDRREGPRSAGF